MKDFYFVIFFILLAVFGFFIYRFIFISPQDIEKATAVINGHSFSIEIADSALKQMQGLSGREKLNENEGMLFVFKDSSVRSFWMKDMKFPIDIIWIDGDKVASVVENLQPAKNVFGAFNEAVTSPVLVDRVLEVVAGTVKRLEIKAGDVVLFHLNN